MLSLKDSLAVLKKTKALLEGHFVLSSGLHSPQYVQCAKLLSYPKKSEKFCKSLSSKIKKKFNKINKRKIKSKTKVRKNQLKKKPENFISKTVRLEESIKSNFSFKFKIDFLAIDRFISKFFQKIK